MPVLPPVIITTGPDGTQTIRARPGLFDLPIAHAALLTWLNDIDLDANQILAEAPITISADRMTVTAPYVVSTTDHNGTRFDYIDPRDDRGRPLTTPHTVTLDHPAPPLPDQITQIAEVHQ